jgi:hypothetical protein
MLTRAIIRIAASRPLTESNNMPLHPRGICIMATAWFTQDSSAG